MKIPMWVSLTEFKFDRRWKIVVDKMFKLKSFVILLFVFNIIVTGPTKIDHVSANYTKSYFC